MTSRSITIMATIIGLAVTALFVTRLMPLFSTVTTPQKYLHFNDVRGMAVTHDGVPWTLNFDQQNSVVDFINRLTPVERAAYSNLKAVPAIQKLTIYRFNAPDIILKPVGTVDKNLFFSSDAMAKGMYLRDFSLGSFLALLNDTYDKK